MPKTKKQKALTSSFLALIAAQILWGINFPVIKLGLRTVPLAAYLSITVLGAAFLVLPLALRHWKPLARKDYAMVIIGSIISIPLGNVVLLMGLQRIPAVSASLIELIGPLLLFILSVEFLKEHMNLKTFLGILIAFAGAAIIVGKPWGATAADQAAITGSLLIVLAVFCDVIGTLICKPVLRRGNTYQITFVYLLAGTLPIALYSLRYIHLLTPSHIGRNGFLAMGFNIIAITFANCFFMYGLKRRKAQAVGIFQYVNPIATAFAGWLILGEVPDKKLALGAVLIFVGIYFAEVRMSHQTRLYHHRQS